MATLGDVWTAEQLMSKANSGEKEKNPMLWGIPGYLTKEETDVYFKFKDEVSKRGGDFQETVYSFGVEEGEAWALGRWLRARKFVYDEVVKMVEGATECRKNAKQVNFYPNPVEALGVEVGIFYSQYPQLYYGNTKDGVPVFFSKPGVLNVDGMACITTLDGILKFHWHVMMHDFANRLRAQKAKNPDKFKKFECFCVLDLDNLTTSQLSKRALTIVKEQASIDSLCFPETMSKMLIVNAPTFFAATWRIIKGWLDPRTASKIEVFSNRSKMEARLLEFIDAEELPSDYGGSGADTKVTMMNSLPGEFKRLSSKMFYIRGYGSETIEVGAGESLEVQVFTRSTTAAVFTLLKEDGKTPYGPSVEFKHTGSGGDDEMPSKTVINPDSAIVGPAKVKVKADSKGSRFSSIEFLVVFYFK